MAAGDYAWWTRRLRAALHAYDLIRVDHFRGFESYWEIPAQYPNAIIGRWAPGPGAALFHAAERQLGRLPIVAEDLGVITSEVDKLRESLGYPGMRVLQFAFGADPKASVYRPHNFERNCVVYTGTHDNDTAVGWFHIQPGTGNTQDAETARAERQFLLRYLGTTGKEIHWDLIRLALASVANTTVFPLQDLLGLGGEARMNLPGSHEGNWRWRYRAHQLTPAIADRLAEMTWLYERCATGS
jgi:4-alpha-glucanotransferase